MQELTSELVYNVNQDTSRAAILVISQVEDHRVQVTLTLTSTEMRDTPAPEQIQGVWATYCGTILSLPGVLSSGVLLNTPLVLFPG